MTDADAAIPEPVRDAWQRVVDGWDDPARHDELFRVVAQHNCFAWAAGRYRQRKDDPVADARLAKLRRAAEVTLLATATARRARVRAPGKPVAILLAALVLALLLALVLTVVIRNRNHATAVPTETR